MQGRGKVVALVLAGGDPSDALARAANVPTKALMPLGGRPMAGFVLEALRGAQAVDALVLVGPDCVGPDFAGVKIVPSGVGLGQSLALGLGAAQAVSPGSSVLVTTADIPWLTSAAVDRFVEAAGDAELAYPIVSREASLASFPTHKRTFVRLQQGHFTGGNLMLLKPTLIAPVLRFMDRLYRARKNPLALAGLVGPGTLLALVTGRADLRRLETIVGARLGGTVRAIVSGDASLAADVDGLEHLDVPMNGLVGS